MSRNKTVYWAAQDRDKVGGKNWNILYEEPSSLYDILAMNENNDVQGTFFKCPSFINKAKNIFVLHNPLYSKIKIEHNYIDSFTEPGMTSTVVPLSESYINSSVLHEKSIKNNTLVQYGLFFYFFAEEDLEMSISSPFFQKTEHLKYGSIVPGSINIGSWFRRINLEFNLWDNINELEIKEGEPIMYLSFPTDVNIKFQRFQMSDKLYNIATTLGQSGSWEPKVSLKKRYQRFKNSRTNEIVLKEIKNNIF